MKFAFLTAAVIASAFATSAQAQTAQVATLAPMNQPARVRTAPVPNQGSGGYSVNNYTYDDGTSENAQKIWSGAGPPPTWGVTCWLNQFDAIGGADTINKISVVFGSGMFPNNQPALGTACNVGVWSDPNQDGIPIDGVLLMQMAGTVTVLGDTYQTFNVPPTAVSGKFFVGAWCANAPITPTSPAGPGEFPAALDQTTGPNGKSWLTGVGGTAAAPAVFDPTNIGAPGHFQFVAPNNPSPLGIFMVRAEGSGPPSVAYCTAKTNSLNGAPLCPVGIPVIGSSGAPSATALTGFTVSAVNCRNNKIGILLYKNSVAGSAQGAQFPFTGGFLCFATGFNPNRSTAVNSGGTPAPVDDCSGVFSIDVNAFAHNAFPPPPLPQGYLLVSGQEVCAQFWGRDPGFAPPNNTQLSNALIWTIGP